MDLATLTLLSLEITLLKMLIIILTYGTTTTKAGIGDTDESLAQTFLDIQELHKTLTEIMTTPGDPGDKSQCLRHHEFAAFIHAQAAEELKMIEPKNGISMVRTGTYTNKNGHVK